MSADVLCCQSAGSNVETVVPDLLKNVVRKGAEQMAEGVVREQIGKLVKAAFSKCEGVFEKTIPGLDSLSASKESETPESSSGGIIGAASEALQQAKAAETAGADDALAVGVGMSSAALLAAATSQLDEVVSRRRHYWHCWDPIRRNMLDKLTFILFYFCFYSTSDSVDVL
eukprot:COSAG01_NODE_2699_length_7235_cov_5.600196_2_plen_171_part_00